MSEKFTYAELDDADETAFLIEEQAEFTKRALDDAVAYVRDLPEMSLEKVVGRKHVEAIRNDFAEARAPVIRVMGVLAGMRQDFENRMNELGAEDLNDDDDIDGVRFGFGDPSWM